MPSLYRILARAKLRLVRSSMSAVLAVAAVALLSTWRFASGWVSSVTAIGCLVCMAVLLLVMTSGPDQFSRIEGSGDGADSGGSGEGGDSAGE